VSTLRTPPAELPETPSTELALIRTEREAVRALLRLVAERAEAEAEAERTRSEHDESADHDYREKRRTLDERYASLTEAARKEDEARRRSITDASIKGEADAKVEFARASRKIAAEFDAAREQAKTAQSRARSKATADAEAADRAANAEAVAARKPIDEARKGIDRLRARLAALHADYKHFGLPDPPSDPSRGAYRPDDPVERIFDRLHKLEPDLAYLEKLAIPKAMKGRQNLWVYATLAVLVGAPLVWLQGLAVGLPLALVVAGVGGFVARGQLYKLSAAQVGRWYYPLSQAVVDAEALASDRHKEVEARLQGEREKAVQAREDAFLRAKLDQGKAVADAEAARDERLRLINEVYAARKVEIQTRAAQDMADAVDAHRKRQADLPALYETGTTRLLEKYQALKRRIVSDFESSRLDLARRWHEGMAAARAALDEVDRAVDAIGPAWDDPSWLDRPAPAMTPRAIRLGEVVLDLGQIPRGISADPALMKGIDPRFAFPALAPFPERANLVVEAPALGRGQALAAVQSAMFRLLTSLPAGMVRFTLVDPVGIGRSFGAFMHLADFDEALVSGQVWTDPRQVEERLAELSAHMEKVTQKYLRDEYASIDEYNAVAGEVAEPYRVLVVADFPAAFDEKAAARLAAILAAGPPCGVLALVGRDLDRPLPSGISAEDLRANALALTWDPDLGGFAWPDPDLGGFPLALDPPPGGELAARLIRRAGEAARAAKRVEVPFEFIAPSRDAWWSKDSRGGIDIPLGKSGATKRQHLALGKGTSQHVLVAGRTGSGKSTLLHALIVNVALNYSPDEVELYLIDFKKGVEFKVYATEALPHAAVVAIESEREFGISVLQRLDAEIKGRADKFREAGVADLAGYRNAPGTPPMPRILLIVDEFQEFFVEEDKLAQEAALVLDRLVRQGRAFGVHVHLGSQSLGGAYALARTTLGQMAVRVALQCAEADAHLILSEHNPAAKLLSRPGEAIYNDANGAPEGNHFFQVVWLGDDRRAAYLRQIRELAEARPPLTRRAAIVFEGDATADLARNPLLAALLEGPSWARSPRTAQAWLGDPVAIKDPTATTFRRQGGNHLLVVGQNPEAALGVLSAALLSLAAQFPPPKEGGEAARHGARFAILDGTPEDDPLEGTLARVAAALPQPVDLGTWRDSTRVVAELAEEVARRQSPDADDGPEVFLVIHDSGRFRDLRRRESDFGFGSPAEVAEPTDHLHQILREGPAVGVHLLLWADNLSNLNRSFDTQGIREFEARVLFQMSTNDSAHLLDAPAASRLGPNRALFSGLEQDRLEKFRPYAVPAEAWLAEVGRNLHSRNNM